MSVKNVKVADTISGEEGAGDGAMKSGKLGVGNVDGKGKR